MDVDASDPEAQGHKSWRYADPKNPDLSAPYRAGLPHLEKVEEIARCETWTSPPIVWIRSKTASLRPEPGRELRLEVNFKSRDVRIISSRTEEEEHGIDAAKASGVEDTEEGIGADSVGATGEASKQICFKAAEIRYVMAERADQVLVYLRKRPEAEEEEINGFETVMIKVGQGVGPPEVDEAKDREDVEDEKPVMPASTEKKEEKGSKAEGEKNEGEGEEAEGGKENAEGEKEEGGSKAEGDAENEGIEEASREKEKVKGEKKKVKGEEYEGGKEKVEGEEDEGGKEKVEGGKEKVEGEEDEGGKEKVEGEKEKVEEEEDEEEETEKLTEADKTLGEVIGGDKVEEGEKITEREKMEEGETVTVADQDNISKREEVADGEKMGGGEKQTEGDQIEEGETVTEVNKMEEGEKLTEGDQMEEGERVTEVDKMEEGETVTVTQEKVGEQREADTDVRVGSDPALPMPSDQQRETQEAAMETEEEVATSEDNNDKGENDEKYLNWIEEEPEVETDPVVLEEWRTVQLAVLNALRRLIYEHWNRSPEQLEHLYPYACIPVRVKKTIKFCTVDDELLALSQSKAASPSLCLTFYLERVNDDNSKQKEFKDLPSDTIDSIETKGTKLIRIWVRDKTYSMHLMKQDDGLPKEAHARDFRLLLELLQKYLRPKPMRIFGDPVKYPTNIYRNGLKPRPFSDPTRPCDVPRPKSK